MRNIVLMLLFVGVAFGAAATGSWFLQKKGQKDGVQETTETSLKEGTSSREPVTGSMEGNVKLANDRIAVRPRAMSVEEVLRYGMGLNKREKHLNEREEVLNQERSRLQLALADIRGEQQQVEGLQEKLEHQAKDVRAVLEEILRNRQQLATDRESAKEELQNFKNLKIEANAEENQNIKKMSEWFQSMEPEDAARAIEKFVDEGKTDLVVKLLANFEEREAADILSSLEDFGLMIELAERFRHYKHPPKEARRR